MSNLSLPTHVGIIMDGNGRWAKKRGLPRLAGHKAGADTFGKIARHVAKTEIKYLTLYAFSTENWRRPADEVEGIMDLLRGFLKDTDKYRSENMNIRVIGSRNGLAPDIKKMIADLETSSATSTGLNLTIAINYGGREEILQAAKKLAVEYTNGKVKNFTDFSEADFNALLYTKDLPDVDLVIRTSGEIRISNFMLWQSAYAEYIFTDVMWPDFSKKHFDNAISEYQTRTRRLGGI